MAPPFSSTNYDKVFTLTPNSINSSNIINGTITGSDIANGTITDVNIAVGTITEAKLSSALQTKLADFDTRLTALETPPVPQGWSGNITFVKQAGGGTTQFITIKTETGPFIATDYTYNSGSNVFSVSLANPSSYVYIQIYGVGGWSTNNKAFAQAVGEPTSIREDGRLWLRYTIPSQFIGQNLTYNFSTYYDD